jgi:hypothetical protein
MFSVAALFLLATLAAGTVVAALALAVSAEGAGGAEMAGPLV